MLRVSKQLTTTLCVMACLTTSLTLAATPAPKPLAPARTGGAAEKPVVASVAAAPATPTAAAAGPTGSPTVHKKASRKFADARGCLEFSDNIAVIRCAEKYR